MSWTFSVVNPAAPVTDATVTSWIKQHDGPYTPYYYSGAATAFGTKAKATAALTAKAHWGVDVTAANALLGFGLYATNSGCSLTAAGGACA